MYEQLILRCGSPRQKECCERFIGRQLYKFASNFQQNNPHIQTINFTGFSWRLIQKTMRDLFLPRIIISGAFLSFLCVRENVGVLLARRKRLMVRAFCKA